MHFSRGGFDMDKLIYAMDRYKKGVISLNEATQLTNTYPFEFMNYLIEENRKQLTI